MNSRTKKIAFSSVSVLVVLAMLVGITMAWFTDTEKANANFNAGVLNIEVTPGQPDPETNAMEFTNLRPMQLDAFQAELGENFANVTTEGFDPIPKYFHPVTVKNAGTLPAQIVLSMEDFGACENKIANVVDNGNGGVKQDGEISCAEAYTLKDVLQISCTKRRWTTRATCSGEGGRR
ncbi:MAG: TasA family protein [Oscillospiraceae bacterium]